jgi:hypothetical protein
VERSDRRLYLRHILSSIRTALISIRSFSFEQNSRFGYQASFLAFLFSQRFPGSPTSAASEAKESNSPVESDFAAFQINLQVTSALILPFCSASLQLASFCAYSVSWVRQSMTADNRGAA